VRHLREHLRNSLPRQSSGSLKQRRCWTAPILLRSSRRFLQGRCSQSRSVKLRSRQFRRNGISWVPLSSCCALMQCGCSLLAGSSRAKRPERREEVPLGCDTRPTKAKNGPDEHGHLGWPATHEIKKITALRMTTRAPGKNPIGLGSQAFHRELVRVLQGRKVWIRNLGSRPNFTVIAIARKRSFLTSLRLGGVVPHLFQESVYARSIDNRHLGVQRARNARNPSG